MDARTPPPPVDDPDEAIDAVQEAQPDPPDARRDLGVLLRRPLWNRPTIRVGAYAWAVVGLIVLLVAIARGVAQVSVVLVPLVIALFPAAVLAPLVNRLRARRLPRAAAASIVLLLFIGVLAGIVTALIPAVANEVEGLSTSLTMGFEQLRRFLASGPFGLDPISIEDLGEQAQGLLSATEGVGERAFEAARAVFEGITGVLVMLITLFFYLKDGDKMARWARNLFPEPVQPDAEVVGGIVWTTIGGYIRGQLLIALIDAVFIGAGLAILRVPLALPLGVLVFFGGLFPIVGAFAAGMVAVLVALAEGGLVKALLVVALIVGVQQLEGHLLQPLILGRAVELHPLAVIVAITAGAILLGVLGAFLSVPTVASIARAASYLRGRIPDDDEPPPVRAPRPAT